MPRLDSTSYTLGFAAAVPEGPIRIGEINSYSTIPQFTIPYRMGWQLAVEEANAAGGVLGRRIEVVSRDDAGKPEDAIRLADYVVDIGPGAGVHGGEIVGQGQLQHMTADQPGGAHQQKLFHQRVPAA